MGRAQQDCSALTAGCAQSGQEPQGCTPSAYSTKGKPKALSLGRAHPASTAQPDCATRLQKAKTPTRTLGAPHTAAVPPRTGSAAPHTSGSWFRTAAVGRGARGSAPPACSGSVRRRQREAPDPTEPRALPHRPPRGLPPPCIPGAGRSRGLPHRRPGGGKRKRWGAAAELEATGPGAARATLTMAARRGCAGRWQRRRLPVRSAPLRSPSFRGRPRPFHFRRCLGVNFRVSAAPPCPPAAVQPIRARLAGHRQVWSAARIRGGRDGRKEPLPAAGRGGQCEALPTSARGWGKLRPEEARPIR